MKVSVIDEFNKNSSQINDYLTIKEFIDFHDNKDIDNHRIIKLFNSPDTKSGTIITVPDAFEKLFFLTKMAISILYINGNIIRPNCSMSDMIDNRISHVDLFDTYVTDSTLHKYDILKLELSTWKSMKGKWQDFMFDLPCERYVYYPIYSIMLALPGSTYVTESNHQYIISTLKSHYFNSVYFKVLDNGIDFLKE